MSAGALWKIVTLLCEVIRWFTKLIPRKGVVLIVEDNPNDAEILAYRLEQLGWRSEVATSGEVAEGLVKHKFYPLACIDLRLPTMSGEALVRLLSKDSPNTKRLIICGEPDDLRRLPPGKAVIYIPKPPTLDSLREILTQLRI